MSQHTTIEKDLKELENKQFFPLQVPTVLRLYYKYTLEFDKFYIRTPRLL